MCDCSLFLVTAATPSKSWSEISVRGEGCDTPSVTITTTVFKQYLTMYFESMNKILAFLVCILSVGKFEFQIKTLFFLFKSSLLPLVL
jgi:hypothetical protein